MIKNSFIISGLIRFFMYLKNIFTNSVYYKIFNKIGDFFGKLFSGSGVYAFFTKKIKETNGSFAEKIVNALFGLFYNIFHKPFAKTAEKAKNGLIVGFYRFMLKNWHKIAIRYYGLFGLIFGAVRLAVKRYCGGGADIITLLIFIPSILMMLFDVSLAGFYEGCGIKKLFGMPQLNISLKTEVKNITAVTTAIVCGAFIGLFTAVPYWYLAVAAIAGVSLVLACPQTGVFMIMAFFPILPTMAVAGIAILVMLGMFVKYLGGAEKHIDFDMFDGTVLIMCIAVIYGVVNSYSVRSSIPIAAIYLVFVGSTFVIRRNLKNESFLNAVVTGMIAVSALVCVYGIYQLLSGQAETTWQDTEMFETMSGRICATFDNPNVFGEYLLILMPLTFSKIITANRKQKTAYFAVFALQLVNMILTYSRGCWIGMMFSMAVMLMLTGRKPLSVLALGIFALPFIVPQSVVDRIMSVGNTADTSTSYRVYIWEGTVKMLKDYMISGIGIGTDAFNSVYPRYALNAISAPHSHNLYLHIICEMGIVGVFAVVLLVAGFFKRLANTAKNSKAFRCIAIAVAAAMGGYLIQGMFDNVWYNYRIYMFFFMTIALGGALYDIAKEKKA